MNSKIWNGEGVDLTLGELGSLKEALNEVLPGILYAMIAEGLIDPKRVSDRTYLWSVVKEHLTDQYGQSHLPAELFRNADGRIVNISSTAGLQGLREGAIYATAKAAVNEYSRCLSVLLRPYNVPVNVVAPGEIVTARFQASRVIDESRMIEDGTLESYGRPIDVARAVAFLASDNSTHISGQVLRVDGGTQCWAA